MEMQEHLGSVLIVEDNPIVSTVLGLVLEHYCSVARATGLSDAAARIDGAGPDIVLADYRLGDGLGTQVLEHARRVRPATLRLLMSGGDIDELDERLADGLVSGFLAKPFSGVKFLGLVQALRSSGGR